MDRDFYPKKKHFRSKKLVQGQIVKSVKTTFKDGVFDASEKNSPLGKFPVMVEPKKWADTRKRGFLASFPKLVFTVKICVDQATFRGERERERRADTNQKNFPRQFPQNPL